MKLTRLQMCVIVMGIALICIPTMPIAEANQIAKPAIEGAKEIIKNFGKIITKILKSGEVDKAHKSIVKAFQKIKENPLVYGLAAAETTSLAKDGVVTIIEIQNSTAYDVKFKLNDDNQCFNIYVNEELSGSESYENLENLTEDEVTKTLEKAAKNAIITYQTNHP